MRFLLVVLTLGTLCHAQSENGEKAIAEGRYQDAAAFYSERLKSDPKNPALLAQLGEAQQLAGEDQKSLLSSQQALKKKPKLVTALVSAGAAQLALDQPQKAATPLHKAATIEPESARVRSVLGDVLLALERYAEARDLYERWIRTEPENPIAMYGFGRAYAGLAGLSQKQLDKIKGGKPYLAIFLAEESIASGDYGQAQELYLAAAGELPKMRGVHSGLAEVYAATGKAADADAETAKETAIGPRDCETDIAECDYAAGRFEKLVREQGAAKSALGDFWLTRAYRELSSQAMKRVNQLPPSLEVHRVKALMLMEAEAYGPAAAEWKQYLAKRPQDGRARRLYAAALFDSGAYAVALPELLAQVGADPGSANWNYLTGEALYRQQQYDRAIPYLTKAVQLDAKRTVAHATLGLCYSRLGQPQLAIPHLRAALSIDEDGSLRKELDQAQSKSK